MDVTSTRPAIQDLVEKIQKLEQENGILASSHAALKLSFAFLTEGNAKLEKQNAKLQEHTTARRQERRFVQREVQKLKANLKLIEDPEEVKKLLENLEEEFQSGEQKRKEHAVRPRTKQAEMIFNRDQGRK